MDYRKYMFKGTAYKSKGELRVAKALDMNNIKFKYEKELVLKRGYDKSKKTTYYPDFYLYKRDIYIEYFGITGDENYKKQFYNKQDTFDLNNIDCIALFPNNLRQFEDFVAEHPDILNSYRTSKQILKELFPFQWKTFECIECYNEVFFINNELCYGCYQEPITEEYSGMEWDIEAKKDWDEIRGI